MIKQRYLLLFLLAVVFIVSGCSSEPAATEEPTPEIEVFALLQQSINGVLTYVHNDHWDGSLPAMKVGETVPLIVHVEDTDEVVITLDGEKNSLNAQVVGGEDGIVLFDFSGGTVQMTAQKPGESQVIFQVQHGGVVYYETPPLVVTVLEPVEESQVIEDDEGDDESEYGEVTEFSAINRSDGQVLAYVHSDHWDGRLPELSIGSSVSLGAVIEDSTGTEIVLDGQHYALGAAVAEGSEAIIRVENHGDHVDIYGETSGETRIVFQLLHNGSVEYETPSIRLQVTAP